MSIATPQIIVNDYESATDFSIQFQHFLSLTLIRDMPIILLLQTSFLNMN